MEMIVLPASARDAKTKVKTLRRTNVVPGVVYGHNVKNMLIQVDEKLLSKALAQAGESSLVELDIDGKKLPVLFKDVSFHPVSDREIHADFYAVNMNEEIETLVPLRFEGEPLAVKTLGGVFVTVHDHIKIRALPAKLPHDIRVDVSGLENFHDTITVAELKLPEGVRLMEKPEAVVCVIQEPRAVEVVATPTAAAAATDAAAAVPGAEAAAPGAVAAAPAADAAKKEPAKK